MDSSIAALLTERFSGLEDPRTGRATRHELIDVVVIAICAVICGADSWVDVEMFGKSKKTGLANYSLFPTQYLRMTPLAGCSRDWTPFSSRDVSRSGWRDGQ